jgi:hypothetical protein
MKTTTKPLSKKKSNSHFKKNLKSIENAFRSGCAVPEREANLYFYMLF